MNFSVNHSIEVGDIISSMGEQVAIADEHEIFESSKDEDGRGSYKTVGEATIRIASSGNAIHTNMTSSFGVVCFLPKEFKGCGILSVRITHVYNKSVEATPIDYIKSDIPLEGYCHGMGINALLQQKTDYPNITRIQIQKDCTHPIAELVNTNGVIDKKCTRCGVVVG